MGLRVTLDLDDRLVTGLDAIAEETKRSREVLMREALMNFVAVEAQEIALLKERIASADRREFASDEEVARVFAKYRSR